MLADAQSKFEKQASALLHKIATLWQLCNGDTAGGKVAANQCAGLLLPCLQPQMQLRCQPHFAWLLLFCAHLNKQHCLS